MKCSAETIRFLFHYNDEAHKLVWEQAILPLTDEQFTRPLNYSWGSIHAQVVHVMGAEQIWINRLMGRPYEILRPEDYPARPAIWEKWGQIRTTTSAYLEGLKDEDLSSSFEYKTSRGEAYSNERGHILLHVVNHGTDHRAQILAMIHQMGGATVEQDILDFIR